MATVKITEKPISSTVKADASVLITQQESVNGRPTEVLRRAQMANLIAALRQQGVNEGYLTERLFDAMKSEMASRVEVADGALRVHFLDTTYEDVPIETGGVPFSGMTFDRDTGYLHIIDEEGNDVIDPCFIGGGGGGGGSSSGSQVVLTNMSGFSKLTVAHGEPVQLSFSFYDMDGDEPTNSSGTMNVYVNNVLVISKSIEQGNTTVNLAQYMSEGENKVRIRVTNEDENYAFKTWTVMAIALSISAPSFVPTAINTGELLFRYTPIGNNISKTIHFEVDGTEVGTATVESSNRQQIQTIPAQTHGAHKLRVWATAAVEGVSVSSNVLVYDVIWAQDGNNTPIIACSFEGSARQFNAVTIPYQVYNPTSLTASVVLAVNGTPINDLTVDRNLQNWVYRPETVGTHTLTITCGTTVKTISLNVTDSGVTVHPITTGLVLDLNPTGHTNNDVNRAQFGYTDGNGVNHPLTFSENFDWRNGGFQVDEKGSTYFCVKCGTTATLDTSFFADDAVVTGKEIKMIFKATNCRDYDAQILSCKSGNVGIVMKAQNATLSSAQTSSTVQYTEDSTIEMDINIESDSENRAMMIWLEGIPSKVDIYAQNDIWRQTGAQNVVIGSNDCDVHIYRIKMYATSLSRSEIHENWIADAPDAEEMYDRFVRNNVYDQNGNISVSKLIEAAPRLHVIELAGPRMTTGKKDPVYGEIRHTYRAGGTAKNFTAQNVIYKVQGTSSAAYGRAAYNLDLDFKDVTEWLDGEGHEMTGWQFGDNHVPITYINIKANVASSECANNVVFQGEYNDFQPYINPARDANPMVRDTMYGEPCVVFFTNTSDQTIHVSSRDLEPGETMLYAVGDMMNSKKNLSSFGQGNTNSNQCCIEISNNTDAPCLFQSDDISEPWDGDHSFEFRHCASGQEERLKLAWKRVLTWVVSTDRTRATNANLTQVKNYFGTVYDHDTEEYRAAKFKAEYQDYFVKDSLLYHYLFTERHTMVDNRAKNVFVSTDDALHWDFTKDYDNDTADGINNQGALTLTYGMEDADQVGSRDVFNAADSVLWVNVRDLLFDELQTMFIQLESRGAWNAERILARFTTHQSARPEALVIEDMYNKYIRPFTEENDDSYLDMLLGTKADQRRQFEIYQERYCSSKYRGTKCSQGSEIITLRAYSPRQWEGVEPHAVMTITPYADMYVNITAGTGVVTGGTSGVRQRAKRGIPVQYPISVDSLNDTETYIYSASCIQDLGDLAPLYVGYLDVANAVKLRNLKVGDGTTGYSNTNCNSVTVGANRLLETLDIRGCANVAHSLDLTGCIALSTLLAQGSSITGVIFAKGGGIVTAHLPAIASLTAVDLNMLQTLNVASWENLTSLYVENCPSRAINTLSVVQAAPNLDHVRLIGIDWTLPTTDLLSRMLTIRGFDEAMHDTQYSVLTGRVSVPIMRQLLLQRYNAAWSDLTLQYATLVAQHTVTFKNWDGTVLNVQYVDQGSNAVDPIANGDIQTPTRPSTEQYSYEFRGWDSSLNTISAARTITATYTETVRTYTVRWMNYGTELRRKTVNYGDEAVYDGDKPTYTIEESTMVYHRWIGWDQCTGRVTKDMVVNAVYERANLGEVLTSTGDMTATYLYGLKQSGRSAVQNAMRLKDRVNITLGYQPCYGDSVEHWDAAPDMVFDGTNHFDTGIDLLKDGIAAPWTLVVDFKFNDSTANSTLMSLWQDDGYMGFKLKYTNGGPTMQWGSNSYASGMGTYREIMVIRHQPGSQMVYVYSSNTANMVIGLTPVLKTIDTITPHTLIFGCDQNDAGDKINFGKGIIHSCRIWYDDLGNTECQKLVCWPRELLVPEVGGYGKFQYANDPTKYTDVDFISAGQLMRPHRMKAVNDNTGGYDETEMHQWMEARLLNAFPEPWRSMIQEVKVPYVIRVQEGEDPAHGEIETVNAHVFLPAYAEVYHTDSEPWIYEGDWIPFFTSNADRIKFRGYVRPEGQKIFVQNTDPCLLTQNNVEEGDMWIDTSDNSIGKLRVNGAWVSANYFWLRGASITYQAGFCIVYNNGGAGTGGYGATGVYGVVPRFSI